MPQLHEEVCDPCNNRPDDEVDVEGLKLRQEEDEVLHQPSSKEKMRRMVLSSYRKASYLKGSEVLSMTGVFLVAVGGHSQSGVTREE